MLNAIGQNRERFLDFFRGFSLIGILTVNLPMLAETPYGLTAFHSESSEIVRAIIAFFFTGKFFILFSFVFGYGFSILLKSLEKKNLDSKRIFYKRLVGLGTLGLIHAIFFFEGDILVSYSFLGFFLYFLKDKSEDTWKKYILTLWVISFFCYGILGVMEYYLRFTDSSTLQEMHNLSVEAKSGNFLTGAFQRAKDLVFTFILVIIPYNWPSAFLMFILGIYAAKHKILSEPKKIWDFAQGKKRYILLVAIVSNLGYMFSFFSTNPILSFFLGSMLCVSGISLSFLYVLSIIWLFFLEHKENFLIDLVSTAGTMSLSNYILQSVLAGFIFYGWGLGYYTKLSPEQVAGLGVLIYSANLLFSYIWKKFFSLGPLEWVLRKWMYWGIE